MDLLERLVNTPGVPGREGAIRDVIEAHARQAGVFDEIATDALGSLVCIRRPRPRDGGPVAMPRRVLLAAHMDQIGFLVSHVSKEGYLRLHPVGAFDPRTLFAHRVQVVTAGGETIAGVMNPPGRPIHTAPPEDLKKIPELETFYVDTGLAPDEARARIAKGDMVVLDGPFHRLGRYVAGGGLDNRVGCWALLRAMEALQFHDCEIHCAWTAQEELGSRGAGPVAFAAEADIGISCDTTVCCEVPGVEEENHVTEAGNGVALQVADSSTLSDMGLVRDMERVAQQQGIKCQRSLMLGGGQDGALIQRARCGVRTIVLSCPVKHLHTATELVHVDDLASYPALLAAYLGSL